MPAACVTRWRPRPPIGHDLPERDMMSQGERMPDQGPATGEGQGTGRPYVLLSAAMSVDGYIDDASPARLVLSGEEDLDRVDAVRAACDAILVGAGTIRRDNPRLRVRSGQRRDDRVARGLAPSPLKVTVSSSGILDPGARFFADADVGKIIYVAGTAAARARERLGDLAAVVAGADPLDLSAVLADLAGRGVARLLVEGGSQLLTQFLAAGLADELQLAIAPFFVGDPAAPRLVRDGAFASAAGSRMALAETRQVGDMALLRYLPGRGMG
jgi:5-amino-6-(5-phosphoribosylamino)uracil reductase